jgi:translation initiation factor 4G
MEIVAARPGHIPFLAWSRLTAERSHVARGPSEIYLDAPEPETLRFLGAITGSDTINPFHYSAFLVAEVDGEPAAALCGFLARDYSDPAAFEAFMRELNARLGRSAEQHEAGSRRIASWDLVHPAHSRDAWVTECVATRPEYRRRGLISALITANLDVGRRAGATAAEVPVYIGNAAAQRAYERAGFTVVSEKRHPEFESVFRFPGMRLLRRDI